MRLYWLLDRQAQDQFKVFWKPGTANYTDYYTKHHPVKEHVQKRALILNHP